MILDWLNAQSKAAHGAGRSTPTGSNDRPRDSQPMLWTHVAYQDEAPSIRNEAEFVGAVEHLQYAVFRRFNNILTRAERGRLDNTIDNTLYKVDRYLERLDPAVRDLREKEIEAVRNEIRDGKERSERLRLQARRAEHKLAQLESLSPEGFEEFVAELFEALGYEVEQVGGSGDEGADLRVRRGNLMGVVQCKYHKKAVVGSPQLQKFLGTVHHTRSHKGFFVTTSTFSLAAEKFVAEHPIELIDGPRLVELVREAIGPGAKRDAEPTWF